MSNANIGWLFYKDYFKEGHDGIDYLRLINGDPSNNEKNIQNKVKHIIGQKPELCEEEILGSSYFKATTTYPGLILGSGNAHELPSVTGQAILGFYFDYTSGLPVIAGSSLKGVLRSAFKHPEYIQGLLSDENIDVKALESEIFENSDVFYDAHIIKADSFGRILGDDYLTPHKDVLKDPIPLRFIKVLPDVTFRFEFDLSDGMLGRGRKIALFMRILEDLGIGAKTNVGYGKFVGFERIKSEEEEREERLSREKDAFEAAVASAEVEKLERFRIDFPDSDYVQQVDSEIEKIKNSAHTDKIAEAFERARSSGNQSYLESFASKYSDDPLAQEYVQKSKSLLQGDASSNKRVSLDEIEDPKALRAYLEAHTPIDDEAQKAQIKALAVSLYAKIKGKKRKNFFKELQLARFVDADFEAEVKQAVQ